MQATTEAEHTQPPGKHQVGTRHIGSLSTFQTANLQAFCPPVISQTPCNWRSKQALKGVSMKQPCHPGMVASHSSSPEYFSLHNAEPELGNPVHRFGLSRYKAKPVNCGGSLAFHWGLSPKRERVGLVMQSSRSHGRQGWDFSPGLQPADLSIFMLGMKSFGQWYWWGQLEGRGDAPKSA